ncbi:hypothetical protein CF319_g4815 [Tilletia indica]|nr:hypothetical protein CF319_g4815 [Tilletia indica]
MSSTVLLFSILITLLLLTTTTLAHPRPAETQPIPDCPIANSRRLNNPKRAASYTNPALCTIAGPYPQTTYSFTPPASTTLDGSSLSGSGLYSIVLPTATLVGSGGQSTVIGGSTVVLTNTPASTTTMSSGTTASGNGTQPSLTPTSTTASDSASTAAVTTTTTATGAGVRRANTPSSFKSIQRFSGLQISLTLFLGVGVLAGIIYFLDELLDVLV